MKKQKCILIGIAVVIIGIGIACLILSERFYEVLLKFIHNGNGSLKELMKNSVGIVLSLALGLTFCWTITTLHIKGGDKYLTSTEKKMLIVDFFAINGLPMLMIIFSIIFFEKFFDLSTLFLSLIAIYSSGLIMVSIMYSLAILFKIIQETFRTK